MRSPLYSGDRMLWWYALLGGCPRMPFRSLVPRLSAQTLRYLQKNNAHNIKHMTVIIFLKMP